MLFNSLHFMIFFPIVTLLYFILPYKMRWFMLLAASCYFYMSFIPAYILILALTIVVDYFAGIYIERTEGRKKKIWLYGSIFTTIAILFVFKYFNFFNANIAVLAKVLHWNYSIESLSLILPIGLSFHTFQSLSYVIEVYRGNQKAEKHFGIYSLYVMFYPQLVAGPIERPQNLLHQFHEKHKFDLDRVRSGLLLMLWGLFKKVVIADRLAIYANDVFNNPSENSGLSVIIAVYFFTFQIYCDFSGYSDIAIGAGRVMGIEMMQNFRQPYFSKSISEFWKRWHISLSTWFKDYLYIPLGGNRVSQWKLYNNLFIVFIVSGLWHGANWTFIIWGALHAFYQIFGIITANFRNNLVIRLGLNTFPKIYNLINIIITFHLVAFAWIFFRANSVGDAFILIGGMFRDIKLTIPFSSAMETIVDLAILTLMVPLLILLEKIYATNPFYHFSNNKHTLVKWAAAWFGILLILNFGVFNNPHSFIYFQF